MVRKISLFIVIILFFINIRPVCGIENKKNFNSLELNVMSKSTFCENGVKLTYSTKIEKNIEEERLVKLLLADNYICLNCNSGCELKKDNQDINIHIWTENEITFVEITIRNIDSELSTKNLIELLKRVEDKNMMNKQYFLYYKGKVTDNFIFDSLEKSLKDVQVVNIKSGYSAIGYLQNQKINFAANTYNTGTYIIIATPIIFISY